MGGATVDPRKYYPKPDESQMIAILQAKQSIGQQYLQNQAKLLQEVAKMPPRMQTFDTARVSKEAAELGVENALRSREYERISDPSAARMRSEMGSRVADITNMATAQQGMDDWSKKHGLTSGYTGGFGGVIGRSAMYDPSTQAGRAEMLRNLGLQQSYIAQTPAPIGGLDPATAIQAEMAAQAVNLAGMQRYQQNVRLGGQEFYGNTVAQINQGMGELQQADQVAQQDKLNYQKAMYDAAVQNQQSKNALLAAGLGAAGTVAGTGLGFMVGGPIGAGIGGSLGGSLGGMAAQV